MDIPVSWKRAEGIFSKKGEIVLVLGKTDSGKSTLVGHLTRCGLDRGHRIGVIDTDIGQASFGPPACMSLTFWYDRFGSPESSGGPILRFVGTTNPARRLLQVVIGAKGLLDKARERHVDTVILDTSGLVQGPLGFQLKQHKIELIKPTRLLVLQKGGELEGLLNRFPSIPGMTVDRIPVSPSAKHRSPEERRAYRRRRFSEYFEGSNMLPLTAAFLKRCSYGKILAEGHLVGLLDRSGHTLGLGLIRGNPLKAFEILTPVSSLTQVRMVQPSAVRLNRDWEEI